MNFSTTLTYLDRVQHLGYREIVNLIDFTDKNKIYLKKNSFDYWIIGFHSPTTSDNNIKFILSFVPFIYTFGIFPLWSDEHINSSIWILDKNLFLIKKLEFQNEYTFFAASWVFWQDEYTSGIIGNGNDPIYIYEPDLKEFAKELVNILKEQNHN